MIVILGVFAIVVFAAACTAEYRPTTMVNMLELPYKKIVRCDNTTGKCDNVTSSDNATGKFKSLDVLSEKPPVHPPVDIETPSFEKATSGNVALELEPIDASKLALEDKPVLINVDGMPLSDFVIHAVGEVLKVTFFIDETVKAMKNPVTLHMTKELPASKTLEIVVELLRQQGLLVGAKAGSLYILKPSAGGEPVDIRVGRSVPVSSAKIVQVVALKYISSAEMSALIAEFYKAALTTKVFEKENAILVTGTAATIRECLNLIDIMDVPYLKQKRVILMRLTYWKPEEFVTQMTAILNGTGFGTSTNPKGPGVAFIPVKFLNSVLAVAPDEQSAKFVMQWKDRLDTPESAGSGEKTFTFFPKFSRATELVETIQRLYGIKQTTQTQATTSRTTLDKEKKSSDEFGSTKASTTTSGSSTTATATGTGNTVAKPLAVESSGSSSGSAVITLPNAPDVQIRIASDDKRNVIIMMTTPSIYQSLVSLLKEIDTPPRQVLIEGTIAELSLGSKEELGLEGFIGSRVAMGNYGVSTIGLLGANSGGTIFKFLTDTYNAEVVLDALAKENKLEILMRPHLMVVDNEEANIQVGDDVPVITSQLSTIVSTTSTTTSPSILNSVSYISTGLLLTIKPTINADGLVTLEISTEVSAAQTNATSTIDSPTIRKRKVKTMVVVGNGQTVILGGIRSKQTSVTESKIPLLGDIPILGYVFKYRSEDVTRTELLIFITPRILTNTDDAHNITREIGERFEWFNK
ncbi:secretin N-terminal domain-containing protein [Candidatus Magnetominusculus dajiuhuensis]|uniref:secretin N-terminal domain-containing protein n=1 Tax=Candidatus Magnetominusculus dajiuhuensis TaxID=3137712 RepID=UPI003B43B8BD